MVAGLISACGAWSGTTVPGNESNIKGYYEHVNLRENVNKALLKKLGCDPLGVRILPPTELPEELDFKDIVLNIVEKDGYTSKTPWMFKDAKMLLLWPYYRKHFPNATWIIVRRNREEIIDSCIRTSFMKQHSLDRAFWERWCLEYEDRIDRLKASGAKYHEISANDVINPEARSTLKKLIKKLKLKWNEKIIQDFIEPSVWHDRT